MTDDTTTPELPPWPAISPAEAWQKLAIAVLRQALLDASREITGSTGTPADWRERTETRRLIRERDTARDFVLRRTDALDFWAELADIDPDCIVERARIAARDWIAYGKRLRGTTTLPEAAMPLPSPSREDDIDVTFDLLNLKEAS